MTGQQWSTERDPLRLLEFLRECRPPGDRRLWLLACESCRPLRHLLRSPRSREALDAAEGHADGRVGDRALQLAGDRMPILADALEDAGCDDRELLSHCRHPGGHVRGCWVVALILGKE